MPPWASMVSMTDWGTAISALNVSPPVWNWPASATIKSLAVNCAIYLFISNPLVKVTARWSSTTASDRDRMVMVVLPRLRPRLAQAMEKRDTRFFSRRSRRRATVPSV